MPTVSENRRHWDSDLEWGNRGDGWSTLWGSPASQWHGTILPRIQQFLPAPTILEIATGMGRWSEFLLTSCDRFIGVDLVARCVAACTSRFASDDGAAFCQNDGRSLDMVEDRSVDFAFSFDSLVHVDDATLGSYMKELSRTLKPDGVAFIHHSNLGSYGRPQQLLAALRSRVSHLSVDVRSALGRSPGWRDPGASAATLVASCENAGIHCISQELVPWYTGHYLIDCFSTLTPAGSKWDRSLRVMKNPFFMDEARSIGKYSYAYERT